MTINTNDIYNFTSYNSLPYFSRFHRYEFPETGSTDYIWQIQHSEHDDFKWQIAVTGDAASIVRIKPNTNHDQIGATLMFDFGAGDWKRNPTTKMTEREFRAACENIRANTVVDLARPWNSTALEKRQVDDIIDHLQTHYSGTQVFISAHDAPVANNVNAVIVAISPLCGQVTNSDAVTECKKVIDKFVSKLQQPETTYFSIYRYAVDGFVWQLTYGIDSE